MARRNLMSSLRFLRPRNSCEGETLAGGWAEVRCGERDWEDFYRKRSQYDKKARSTHGLNCTGGIVGGLGAFGGFVIPPVMGLFVKLSGIKGYSQGFAVFLGLSLLSIALFAVLSRYAPKSAAEAAV